MFYPRNDDCILSLIFSPSVINAKFSMSIVVLIVIGTTAKDNIRIGNKQSGPKFVT